ncbi:hypothetical protein YC2023_043434 [Brassica napus]
MAMVVEEETSGDETNGSGGGGGATSERNKIIHIHRVDGSVARVDEVGDKITIRVGGEEETIRGGEETMIGDINGTQDNELVE